MFTNRKFEPAKVKFSFSTDVEEKRIRNEMAPLKGQIEHYQQKLRDKQEEQKQKKLEVRVEI